MKSPKGLFGSKINRKRTIEGYLFASPWFLGFFLFTAGPMIVSFVMSFFNYDVLTPASYIGFDNYRVIFTDDPLFWKALYNTFFYAFFQIPSYLVVSLVVAIMMNQKIRGIRVFRTLYYLPAVTAGPATMMLWLWLFDPSSGLINQALWALGIYDTPLWLQSEVWSKPSLILMSLWYAGSSMVIYLAGLQGIPQELYDAASVDGAGTWRQFWKITLPMLSPTIFFNLIMGIINAFQIFEQAYLMTEGGPMNSTMFYALYLYYNAFKWLKMGYASALAWVLFAIILILTLIQFKFANRWVYYELADRGKEKVVKQTISTAEQARQLKKRRQRIDAIKKILVFIILSLGALLYIAPFGWSLPPSRQIFRPLLIHRSGSHRPRSGTIISRSLPAPIGSDGPGTPFI